jgi:hypothetical protein
MNFKHWLLLNEKITVKGQEFRDPLFALQYIQKNHSNPENLVVTYTAIDKVGINPKSGYNTPLGIYFYPLNYVIEMKMDVPFAKEQPYINVCEFTRPHKILQMTSDTSNQKEMGILPLFFPKEDVDNAIQEVNKKINSKDFLLKSNYSMLWLTTLVLSNFNPVQWNATMRKCGIDGFVDNGTSTIHPYEPTQGVVFEIKSLKKIHVIDNKKNQEDSTDKVATDKMTDEQIIQILQSRRNIDISAFLRGMPNKYERASLIVNNKPELTDDDVKNLLNFAGKDREQIAELIAGKKKILTSSNVRSLISAVTDKEKMASRLGSVNINKLDLYALNNLIYYSDDKEKMANIFIKYKTNLTKEQISELLATAKRA